MKNRLIKATILIAITTLVMLNIQILFDTSNSTLFQGSTAKASDEYYGDEDPINYNYLDHHYLKKVWCVIAYLEMDIDLFPIFMGELPDVKISGDIDFNGRRLKCKEIARDIFCKVYMETDCVNKSELESYSDSDGDQ